MSDIKWIVSIDIGKKNFSFYVEEVDVGELPRHGKGSWGVDGTPTLECQKDLDAVCACGKRILLENVDLTTCGPHGVDSRLKLDPAIMHNMTSLLDKYKSYWDQCDIVVIEKQMSFGSNCNTMALKLGQHCWSYFSLRYSDGERPTLVEFPAYHKTQVLGARKVMGKRGAWKAIDKPARKKWSVEKGIEILCTRGDADGVAVIKSRGKKDDLCDVICQLQAYKYLYM